MVTNSPVIRHHLEAIGPGPDARPRAVPANPRDRAGHESPGAAAKRVDSWQVGEVETSNPRADELITGSGPPTDSDPPDGPTRNYPNDGYRL